MNSPSHPDSHHSNWELLGELELLLNADQNAAIHEWLSQTLEPLKLHEEIVRRVETSLQEAAGRALNTYMGNKRQYIHLRIHVPLDRTSKGTTWGFFRVEKNEEAPLDGKLPAHATELFLFLEAH